MLCLQPQKRQVAFLSNLFKSLYSTFILWKNYPFNRGLRQNFLVYRHTEAETPDPSYHVHFDIHLYEVKEHLQKYLLSRKSLEDFVRQHMWREIENLPA